MIIAAKAGRSIILTTHFLDEADVLSDRIGILKDGRLVTCGSSLFLKHTLGAGYTLKYESADSFDVSSHVQGAELISEGGADEERKWKLNFGVEKQIPSVLVALSDTGAENIQLELTTLEEVFLETGKEDFDDEDSDEDDANENGDNGNNIEGTIEDVEVGNNKEELQTKIWDTSATISPISWMKKLMLVEHFVRTNALKMKGAIFLNIGQPMVYMVVGLVVASIIPIPTSGTVVANPAIQIQPWLSASFFGVESLENNPISPLQPVPEPDTLSDYFGSSLPVVGGHFAGNSTLQYAQEVDGFALQFAAAVLANYSMLLDSSTSSEGISTSVQQLPYVLDSPFRFDLLFLPMMLAFGFAGLAFTVLDVLLLKGKYVAY